MHTLDTWTIVNAVLWHGLFAVASLFAAWLFTKWDPGGPLSGRVLLVTGALLGVAANLVFAARNLLVALGYWQVAQDAHFLGQCFLITGAVGIAIGLFGFLRQPKLPIEDMPMTAAYKRAAALCFLALVLVSVAYALFGAHSIEDIVPAQSQSAWIWWRITTLWMPVSLVLQGGVLWHLLRSPTRAKAVFASRRCFLGVFPVSLILVSLLYAPLWLYIAWLQWAAAVQWAESVVTWLGLIVSLGVSMVWYGAYPYLLEYAVRRQSSEAAQKE